MRLFIICAITAMALLATDAVPKKKKAYAPISFKDQKRVVWKHDLGDIDPQITCRDPQGEKVETYDGWKVIDKNTVSIEFSTPKTAHCTARRTPDDD